MEEKGQGGGKSLSIRKALICMIAFMLLVSVLLLHATGSVSRVYDNLNKSMLSYKQWQKNANNLQIGSDYLTEQVRCFVITGDLIFLDNYFEEANVTRRRDNAVEDVRRLIGKTEAYESLTNAMDESLELMNREYYAMCLAIAGYGLEETEYPQEVRKIELSAEDLASPPEVQRENARLMVCDEVYLEKKQAIASSIQECLSVIDAEIERSQEKAEDEMKRTIWHQRIMISVSIGAIIITMLMFMHMVVWPLLKAVTYIQKDQEIPVEGSEEFRFLVKEYNTAHQSNIDQKKDLAYEATHDNLTGIYNRNGYDAIKQSVDWNSSALVIFDLDQFKSVNDTYGHRIGDLVLARAAKTIQNAFRSRDFVCRIGGDEFVVIMVSVTTDTGNIICDKVRRINEELLRPKDDIPGIHLSAGAAYGAMFPDYDTLFKEADAAMYRVKKGGLGGCEIVQKAVP